MGVQVHLAVVDRQTCMVLDWVYVGGTEVYDELREMTHLDHVGVIDFVESYRLSREVDVCSLFRHRYVDQLPTEELYELLNRFPVEKYTWQAVVH